MRHILFFMVLGTVLCVSTAVLTYGYLHYFVWEKFTHPTYGYSIEHPRNWTLSDEKRYLDFDNKVYSSLYFLAPNGLNTVSVSVHEKEWVGKYQASSTMPVQIQEKEYVAYVFPSSEPCPSNNCTFYIIEIPHNGFWYQVGVGPTVREYDRISKRMISSFTFSTSTNNVTDSI